MWQGTYVSWNPIPLDRQHKWGDLSVEAVHDDWEGFRIWLRPEKRNYGLIIIRFEAALMYTMSDEIDRLSIVEVENDKDLTQGFWKVQNSSLVREFKRQGAGVRDDDEINHYVFISSCDCIDVLSMLDPEIVDKMA